MYTGDGAAGIPVIGPATRKRAVCAPVLATAGYVHASVGMVFHDLERIMISSSMHAFNTCHAAHSLAKAELVASKKQVRFAN